MTGALIDLRFHLLGGMRAEFIRQIAFEKKIDLRRAFDDNGGFSAAVLQDFWRFLPVLGELIKTPADLHRAMCHVGAIQAEQNIIYSEVFLSPALLALQDPRKWQDFASAVHDACNTVRHNHDIYLVPVVEIERHLGTDEAKLSAKCAVETAELGVRGLALMGDATTARFDEFTYCFDMAREADLGLILGLDDQSRDLMRAIATQRFARFANLSHAPKDVKDFKTLVAGAYNLETSIQSAKSVVQMIDQAANLCFGSARAGFDALPFDQSLKLLRDASLWDDSITIRIMRDAVAQAFCLNEHKEKLIERVNTTWTNT